jgi:hypothetical protein
MAISTTPIPHFFFDKPFPLSVFYALFTIHKNKFCVLTYSFDYINGVIECLFIIFNSIDNVNIVKLNIFMSILNLKPHNFVR